MNLGSFRILLPFFRTSWGAGVLNSAIFNSFHNPVEFGTILEGLLNFGGGGWTRPPNPPSVRHCVDTVTQIPWGRGPLSHSPTPLQRYRTLKTVVGSFWQNSVPLAEDSIPKCLGINTLIITGVRTTGYLRHWKKTLYFFFQCILTASHKMVGHDRNISEM